LWLFYLKKDDIGLVILVTLLPFNFNLPYTPTQDPLEEAKLTCAFDHRGVPYLYLMPAKVEYHHLSGAGLVTFHDVLSDLEIQHIKNMAHPIVRNEKIETKLEVQYFPLG